MIEFSSRGDDYKKRQVQENDADRNNVLVLNEDRKVHHFTRAVKKQKAIGFRGVLEALMVNPLV